MAAPQHSPSTPRRYTRTLGVRVSKRLLDRIDLAALEAGMLRADWVRHVLASECRCSERPWRSER